MKATWIIENFTKESSYDELILACKELGHKTVEIKGDFKYSDLENINNECVVFNGSIEMSKLVKNHLSPKNCRPICFNTWDNYLCSKYYSHYGNFMFNDRYMMMSLAEVARNKFFVYGNLGKEALIFIRPDSGEKTFQAQLLDLMDVDRFVEKNADIKHDLVLVSSPKKIIGEWRFVVAGKEIVTYSTYKYQDQITKIPGAPQEAIDKCKEILNDVSYSPDPVFCMDICESGDHEFYLLELTSFSSCGLYSCNKYKIVSEVSKIAENLFAKN